MPGNTSWLNTITLSEFSDLVAKQFSHVQEMVQPQAARLFIQEDLTSHPSQQKRYDEVDVETFGKLKREGENSAKARAGVGYNNTMNARRYAMEINVSYEFRRYGNEQAVKSDLYSLNHFIEQRTELNLTHVLTFCNATAYTDMDGESINLAVGDGLALVSSVHTLKHSALTYSNNVSGNPAFSQGALELAESLTVSDIYSNFGEKRVLQFNTIVTSDDPTTCRAVKQVLQSTADVDAAHAGVVNTYKGKYSHVELPYLATTATGARDATKKRWWFLIAAGQGTRGWQAYYAVFEATSLKTPSAGNNGEDVHNDDWTFGTRGSHGIVALSGRGLIASLPTN